MCQTNRAKCPKCAQGSPMKVRIPSRYDDQKSLSTSFMATSSILLYTLPVLANSNGIHIYWDVPKGMINAVHARLPGSILTAWYAPQESTDENTVDYGGSLVCSWGGICLWLSAYSALLDLWPISSIRLSSLQVLMVTPRDSLKVWWLLPLTTHQLDSVNSPSDLDSTVSI